MNSRQSKTRISDADKMYFREIFTLNQNENQKIDHNGLNEIFKMVGFTPNDKQKQEFKAAFQHPGGYWRTFTVPLLALSTYVDPGKNPVKEGDLFVDLEVYVGEPGLKARVLLDDVQIYRRVYR